MSIIKSIFVFFAGLISFLLLGLLISGIFTGFRYFTLPYTQFNSNVNRAEGIIKNVNDPDRCLAINKQFQELKAEIDQIQNVQIITAQTAVDNFKKGLPEDRTKWAFPDSQAFNQVQSQLTGQQQYLSTLKAKYNSFTTRPDVQPCKDLLPTFIPLT
jgi:hypothetical protein